MYNSGNNTIAAGARSGSPPMIFIDLTTLRRPQQTSSTLDGEADRQAASSEQGGDRRSKRIEAHRVFILKAVEDRKDIIFAELQKRLARPGAHFGIGTIWRFFDRHDITLRKRRRMPPNRNGLFVDTRLTRVSGHAERLAALDMIEPCGDRPQAITLGSDKGFDAADFVMELREINVTPHIARNTTRRSAIDGRTTRHPGYVVRVDDPLAASRA